MAAACSRDTFSRCAQTTAGSPAPMVAAMRAAEAAGSVPDGCRTCRRLALPAAARRTVPRTGEGCPRSGRRRADQPGAGGEAASRRRGQLRLARPRASSGRSPSSPFQLRPAHRLGVPQQDQRHGLGGQAGEVGEHRVVVVVAEPLGRAFGRPAQVTSSTSSLGTARVVEPETRRRPVVHPLGPAADLVADRGQRRPRSEPGAALFEHLADRGERQRLAWLGLALGQRPVVVLACRCTSSTSVLVGPPRPGRQATAPAAMISLLISLPIRRASSV